jgi:hypothetical protein
VITAHSGHEYQKKTRPNSLKVKMNNMKTLKQTIAAFAFLCAIGSSCQVNAQDSTETLLQTEIGFRFMPTFSSFRMVNSNGGVVKGDLTLSYGGGLMIAHNFNKNVGLQGEIIYNNYSQRFKDNELEHIIHINYINIPLMLSLNTDKKMPVNFNVVLGPQLGLNVGSKMETSGNSNADTVHAVLAVKQSDLGFAYGAGFDFALNKPRSIRLDIGFRGVLGLIDVSDHNQNKTTDSYLILDRTHIEAYSAYIGLTFAF